MSELGSIRGVCFGGRGGGRSLCFLFEIVIFEVFRGDFGGII